MKIRKAVIPAAGLGTRFLPATKAQAKEMLPIVDKPTIQYIVEEAVASGITDIIIVTGRNKKPIEDHFDRSMELEMELEKAQKQDMLELVRHISEMANIYYVRQKEAKGLGHAVLAARHFIGNEPFAVMLGDDVVEAQKPCLGQMIDIYNEYRTCVLGVQHVDTSVVHKYGIVDCKKIDDRVYKVRDLVEKPKQEEAPSNIAILGRYILTPDIFDYLRTQDAGAGGEIQLTDALRRQSKDCAMYAYDFVGKRYDVGSKIGFLQANVEFALRNPQLHDEMVEYLNLLHENMDDMIKVD